MHGIIFLGVLMQLVKLKSINYDTITVSQDRLNIVNKERVNLLPWKGQFSPQLIQYLLETYSHKTDQILDPFMGSGTVLYESALMNLNAIGVELNPAAVKMAQVYLLSCMTITDRKKYIMDIENKIGSIIFDSDMPLFNKSFYDSKQKSDNTFFDIKKIIESIQEPVIRLILETYLILMDPKDSQLTAKKARFVWQNLKNLIMGLPYTQSKLRIINSDCRQIPLKENSINLVVTSPPYINVFNYHQQKRASIEAMGWDILSLAKSEIGSNRKHRGNRYFTVIQYCLDMAMVIYELSRVCKPKAKLIFVVGRESNVKKTSFCNSEIIVNIARQVFNIDIKCRHERLFKNRYGQIIKEDILLFKNPQNPIKYNADPRQIAHCVLEGASDRVPKEEQDFLSIAIKSINQVASSPIYKSSKFKQEPTAIL